MNKLMTDAWLVWRIGDSGELEQLGLYHSKEAATKTVAVTRPRGWRITCVPFIGWGFIGRVSTNEDNPTVMTLGPH